MIFQSNFPAPKAPAYTTRRVPRAKATQHTAATTPSPFSLPLVHTAEFGLVLELPPVLEAVDEEPATPVVSEASWIRMNMSLVAR